MLGVGMPDVNAGVFNPEFMAEFIELCFWGGVRLLSRRDEESLELFVELAFMRSSVRLFLVPRGRPARFDSE